MQNKKIAIIGAGISGLSLAFWLQKKDFQIKIFEQSDRVGGSIVTEEEAGFLLKISDQLLGYHAIIHKENDVKNT